MVVGIGFEGGAKQRRRKILIVDDARLMRHLLAKSLANYGFTCLTAENGSVAWQTILRERPDALITDIEMPISDGLQLIERIRASSDARIRRMPILVCSSVAHQFRESVEARGANRFINKPIDVRSLKLQLDTMS